MCGLYIEGKCILHHADAHMPTLHELAEENLVRQRLLDVLLYDTRKRTRAHLFVVPPPGKPIVGLGREFDCDVAIGQLSLELENELLDNLRDNPFWQMTERDHRIETIAELRREEPLDRILIVAHPLLLRETNRRLGHVGRTGVGSHDEDYIAEIDLLAVVIRQLPVIHHLQQDVEEIRVRLLDLVKKQNAMRMLIDAVRQQTALIEPYIARRCANETRYRVALHVLGHIEAEHLDTQNRRELTCNLGLADTCRA